MIFLFSVMLFLVIGTGTAYAVTVTENVIKMPLSSNYGTFNHNLINVINVSPPTFPAMNKETGNRYIVKMKQRNAFNVSSMGLKKIKDLELINSVVVSADAAQLNALRNNPLVDYVEEDAIVTSDADTIPWGISRIGADALLSAGKTGQGVKVAVLDTGIDYNHPDLSGRVKGGASFVNYTASYMDDFWHGTHVAGIIAASSNGAGVVGVAPEASLYAVKVLDNQGSGWTSDIIEGIDWSINNGMQVISMSLGATKYVASFEDAVNRAYNAGIVIVAAAGNNASAADCSYPARFSSVICVSSTDSQDNIASTSTNGPSVELAAPGVSIYSDYPGNRFATASGTSMATPHVTGTIALLLANPMIAGYDLNNNGKWDPAEVRKRLQDTSQDLGVPGKDNYYGYGIVNALLAVPSEIPIYDIRMYSTVDSGSSSPISVRMTKVGQPISGVGISMSTDCGGVSPSSGTTDSNGYFYSTLNAMSVASNMTCSVSITISLSGYQPTTVSSSVKIVADSIFRFSLYTTPDRGTVQQGGSATVDVTVNKVDGIIPQDVSLSCSDLPAGVSCSLNPNTVKPSDDSPAYSKATISVSGSVPIGTYNIMINGVSGKPGAQYGAGYTYYLTVSSASSSTYSVTFSQSGIPAGKSWGVTVGGNYYSSTTSSITVSGLSGSVSYYYVSSIEYGRDYKYTCVSGCSGTISSSASLTAPYNTQYGITMRANPFEGGKTSPAGPASPTDLSGTYWYNPGASISISATPNSGYTFSSWSGSGTGSYSGASASAAIKMNGPITQAANFASSGGSTYSVTFSETGLPSGTSWDVNVGGKDYIITSTSVTISGLSGNVNYYFKSPVLVGSGILYSCSACSGSVSSATTRSASYSIAYYQLLTVANPSAGGTISPAGGWYAVGASVSISATPVSGYTFSSWTGSGTGSYSGALASATVAMNGPITETANFASSGGGGGSIIFSDNFESGNNVWQASGLWHITTRRYSSATHSFWYGQESTKNYNTGGRNFGYLTSPQISLAGASAPKLSFKSRYMTESGTSKDKKIVQISTDGGNTWSNIKQISDNMAIWNTETISLSGYIGKTMRIRFYFDTVDGARNILDGWFIDDVVISR